MIDLEHSPLGGSAAHRFLNCSGSFLLQKAQIEAGTFENVTSEFASLGTAAHELASRCLIEGKEPYEYLGEEISGYKVGWPGGIELDAVSVYVTHCQKIAARDPAATINIERTIKAHHIHPLLKGTLDFDCYLPKYGFDIVDYKNGAGIGVGAIGNRQLLYYGFLKLLDTYLPWHRDTKTPMRLGIVQPNHYGIFEEPDTWETTTGEVWQWGHDVLLPKMHSLMRIEEIFPDDFNPGNHCQFCPVLLDCPKMQQAFKDYASADEEFIVMLTDQELDTYYGQRELARRFMNALEQTVYARLVAKPGSIKSAKLVEKKVARVWKPGAQPALEATFGDAAWEPKKLKSPAGVEKLSSRGKEIALEWGYKPESAGLSVAPLDDPRPEAKPKGNADVFGSHAKSAEEQGF